MDVELGTFWKESEVAHLVTVVPHKSKHLLDVLVLRLTEYHYYESLGYKGYIDADCSFEFKRQENEPLETLREGGENEETLQ